MEVFKAVTFVTEAGVTEVNATVIKGQHDTESALMEGRDDINSDTEAGVKEVTATMIKGKDVIELVTIQGCDAVTSATEASVTEVNATVIKGHQDIELVTIQGCDAVTPATEAGVTEIAIQAETYLCKMQSIGAKVNADLTSIKTQKEDDDFALQCKGRQTNNIHEVYMPI
ncbi:hypothetical protein DPMN_058723 [Dreissena polymorpha]|uniref:Uncharacterized protein n=1 Tax=Dreissena polymorpha TaxID=45954 RepID=A0A9D4C295_DREPO|nr:hypothetical protein DPMN_058723 [Dreissena polymorpha]